MTELETAESPSVIWATLEHASCSRHRAYSLSCAQFDALLERSGGRCEICGEPGRPQDKGCCLNIDHEHFVGQWAVRGLLCYAHNLGLRSNRRMPPDPRIKQYLANAWYLKELERRGLSSDIPPEPGLGSTVATFTRCYTRYSTEGRWDWITIAASATNRKSWADLWQRSGPFHLRVIENCTELSADTRRYLQPWVGKYMPPARRRPRDTAKPTRAQLEKRIASALDLAAQDDSLFGPAITAILTGTASASEAAA